MVRIRVKLFGSLLEGSANGIRAGLSALRTYRNALCRTVLIAGVVHTVFNVALYALVKLVTAAVCSAA